MGKRRRGNGVNRGGKNKGEREEVKGGEEGDEK